MASTGTFGRHVVAEITQVSFEVLDNVFFLSGALTEASEKAGATIVGMHTKVFEPQGCSVNITLAESHVAIHTFPEKGYASFDAYTCGTVADPYAILEYVLDQLGGKAEYELKHRGLLDTPILMKTVEAGIIYSKKK